MADQFNNIITMIQEDDEELRSPKVTILDLDLESDQNDD